MDFKKITDAVKIGQLDLVQSMLLSNPQLVEIVNGHNSSTLLHYAAEYGHLEIVEYLFEKAPYLIRNSRKNEATAVHLACQNGHLDVAEFLLEKEPLLINYSKSDGSTALHLACLNGHLELVKFLIQRKPSLVNFIDVKGRTVLHSATLAGRLDIVNFLLDEAICLKDWTRIVNSTDVDGWNVMHLACRTGRFYLAEYLLENQPDLVEVRDVNGKTALDLTSRYSKYHRRCAARVLRTYKTLSMKNASKGKSAYFKGKLFIIYSSLVRSRAVHKMADQLRDIAGYQVLIDKNSMNENSSGAKVQGIPKCHTVLCFISEAFEKSPKCMREFEFAWKKDKNIIPIRIEKNYSSYLQFAFRAYSSIDYFNDDQLYSATAAVIKAIVSHGN